MPSTSVMLCVTACSNFRDNWVVAGNGNAPCNIEAENAENNQGMRGAIQVFYRKEWGKENGKHQDIAQ